MKRNIALIGFMGTGKTTVGKLLAQRLDLFFTTTDEMIEKKCQKTIKDIFRDDGEDFFRKVESEIIRVVTKEKGQVIATGGGATTVGENYFALEENAYIICLQASPESILARVEKKDNRPMLSEIEKLQKIKTLLAKRIECYNKADFSLATDEDDLDGVVEKIISFLTKEKIHI